MNIDIYKKNLEDTQNENLFKIEPEFFAPSNYDQSMFNNFINSIEMLILSMLPKNIVDESKSYLLKEKKEIFFKINQLLPIIKYTSLKNNVPFCFSLSVFCSSNQNQGASKFISDMINKWLIPGKIVLINAQRSFQFKFKNFLQTSYFLSEYFVNINTEKELAFINNNLSNFINDMKLIILSYQHSKYLGFNKFTEKNSSLIQKNIPFILNQKSNENFSFDQLETFLFKLSEEKKLKEIKETLALLMSKKPQTFDIDIFDSLHNISLIFKGNFTSIRNPKHVSKIIALQYFFKKSIQQIITNLSQNKRIVNLKLIKTKHINSPKNILGILIVMNIMHENEYFEKSYILECIAQIIKDFNYVNNSFIIDHRSDKLLSFYLEIEKLKNPYFSIQEIKELKKRLPEEFKEKMKNLIHPIFLPRNEEEILRNIIALTKQLKYVNDIPQLIISYEKQTSKNISFLVILLRLIKKNSLPIKELFLYSQTFLKFTLDESKIVGCLKKKYPKEASVFRVSLKKFDFLRRDYSLDLRKARAAVSEELKKILGDFRDFNGGMLTKQREALEELKKLLPNLKKSQECLLEDFFYSIKPGIMQSILNAKILKKFFLMFLDILKKSFSKNNFIILTNQEDKYFFIMIKTPLLKLKEDIILAVNKLKLNSFNLISSSFDKNEEKIIGYVISSLEENKDAFHQEIIKILQNPTP